MIGHGPDPLLRLAVDVNCGRRLRRARRDGPAARSAFVERLRRSPIAEQPDRANEQHYDLPVEFFRVFLGPRLKYSCCYWPDGIETLDKAEEAMLELTCERAQFEDGMDILDLGCGWGSLAFWLAERYPRSRILAVSNSRLQREFIASRPSTGIEAITADANVFDPRRRFDRVVSIEMLEHVRNYEALLARVAGWLAPEGRFFAHVFSHRRYAYPYTDGWMARTFFTGGTMLSHDLLPELAGDRLELIQDWTVGGWHYRRTTEGWLERLDANRERALPVLATAYGVSDAREWLARWRLFLMACSGLFGYAGGREWQVSQYLFAPRSMASAPSGEDGGTGTGRADGL